MYRRSRRVNRPQPPHTPRYIAVAVDGAFAIVPVSQPIGAGSRDGERQSMAQAEERSERTHHLRAETRASEAA